MWRHPRNLDVYFAGVRPETNLAALGVDINDPNQSVSIYLDHTRAASSFDQKLLIISLLTIPTILLVITERSIWDEFLALVAMIMCIIALGLMVKGHVIFRSQVLKPSAEPLIKIEADGITIRFVPLQFNLMRWEELEEASARRLSVPVFGGAKISSEEFFGITPVNPNILYKLALDEKTKTMLGRSKAIMNRPSMRMFEDYPPIGIPYYCLPFPLTPADLVLLINTRKSLALSKQQTSLLEAKDQSLAPIEAKKSIIEIKPKDKHGVK